MRKPGSTNTRNEADLIARCPLAAAMKLVGGRWKLMLIWYVSHGIHRYGALKTTMASISEKMLYSQLRELERDGLFLRVIEARAVRYELTELGRSLLPLLASFESWSRDHGVGERLLKSLDLPVAAGDDSLPRKVAR